MSTVPAIVQMLREHQFDSAIPIVSQMLRDAAAQSPKRLSEVARDLVRWQGVFRSTAEAAAAEPYFRTVYDLLQELAGPESPAALSAAENLAGILGSVDKVDEAIALREKILAHLDPLVSRDDRRVDMIRNGLAILYQRAGRDDKLNQLYGDARLCEHLQTAEEYVRAHGGHVVFRGQPWSANCRVWIYFDVTLDCERLIESLGLDPCVRIHDHRGTHDGSERGIVCTIHNDAIMGRHPLS
jgi:hypothetical protein